MPEIDPRFQEVMARNEVLDPAGLMTLPAGAEDTYEELPLYATLSEVDFLAELPVAQQNRVLIRTAVAQLRVVLDHAATRGETDYFCAVTTDFWDEFDDGGLITPRFLYANPAREFFQNVVLLPARSRYSEFTAAALDHSPEYVLNDQPDPFAVRDGVPPQDAPVGSVWVQHTTCRVPASVVV